MDEQKKEDCFDFSSAIRYIKAGTKACRKGWNGKGMFIYLNRGSTEDKNKAIDGIPRYLFDDGDTGISTRLPNINMRSASGATVTGWLASQTDMLAEDWMLAE